MTIQILNYYQITEMMTILKRKMKLLHLAIMTLKANRNMNLMKVKTTIRLFLINFTLGETNPLNTANPVRVRIVEQKEKNMVKIFPGPETVARGIRDELTTFNKFMTIDMIDEIVHRK